MRSGTRASLSISAALVLAAAFAAYAVQPDPYRGVRQVSTAPDPLTPAERIAPSPVASCLGPCADISWITLADVISVTNMGDGVEGAAAGLIGGKIYVSHGFSVGDSDALRIYDIATDSWSLGPNANRIRSEGGGIAVGGKLYSIGGRTSPNQAAVEIYDPVTNTWSNGANMPTARRGAGIGVINGLIHVVGGDSGGGPLNCPPCLGVHEVYDPVANTWSTRAALPTPLGDVQATVVIGAKLYVFGGHSNGASNRTQIYDDASDTWSAGANMPTPRASAIAGTLNGYAIVIGGLDGSGPGFGGNLSVVEVYNPLNDTWCTGPSKPTPASELGNAAVSTATRIYAIGSGAFGLAERVHEALELKDDTIPPTIVCPAKLTLECPADPNQIAAWRKTATATDNCDPDPAITSALLTHVPGCGQTFVDTYEFTATDSEGNSAKCQAVVEVVDTKTPALVGVPADTTVSCENVPPVPSVTATDACDTNPTVTMVEVRTDGNCTDNFTLKRTWTAKDSCSNSISATQTITVQDLTKPKLVGVPADETVSCESVPSPPIVTATDNCDMAPKVALVEVRIDGNCADNYTLKRTWTATDRCGNATSATQTITVQDLTKPKLVGVPADQSASCDAVPVPPVVTATDNCDPAPKLVYVEVRTDGNCQDNYTLTRTWTATDRCSNATSATQVIAVSDTSAPVPVAVLMPAAPREPLSPHSVCSAPSSRAFVVTCGATDNCDPAPVKVATLVTKAHAVVDREGTCVEIETRIAVDCGETVVLQLVAPPCPAKGPRSPAPPVVVHSGMKIVTAERIVLEVQATDRCGNSAVASWDPTANPSPLCDDKLPDGTCCPALGYPPDPRCKVPLCGRSSP